MKQETTRRVKTLSLLPEEFDAINRQATRLLEHKGRLLTNREMRRKDNEHKLLKGLVSRLIGPKEGELEAVEIEQKMLNRNDLRAIEGLCKIAKKAIDEMILPGYHERMMNASDEQMRIRYKDYHDKASKTSNMYAAILFKIEGVF